MNAGHFLAIFISSIFVSNVILSRFLGLCSFIAISKETRPALAMSSAVLFVIVMSSAITWVVYNYLLIPLDLAYLRTISFILVIASCVQLVEMVVRKFMPALYRVFGIYLPLITVNCAVLGVAVLNTDMFFSSGKPLPGSFIFSIFQGVCVGIGYTLAMLLMSAIRERLEYSRVPEAVREFPIAFVTASLMSLSFMGFNGFRF
ncbi:MAG: RnfABCDGE type electron transport complex subunit A [Candidatus Omnitrophota bacterium]|jgi:electron transport complex protein RnfA|nr:RnfABCDGE type electron transport complex subunit A [Candidatus Omnitrophota bacterium]